ncbi:hypothetical protein ACGGAQ_28975 [Micromonospora sp. NPDC047557]|uniref:hypothetical protein n=1 Tax=Micromonospora sp. NPDC047557 TaxID=3364250 RepID=UPI003718CAEE
MDAEPIAVTVQADKPDTGQLDWQVRISGCQAPHPRIRIGGRSAQSLWREREDVSGSPGRLLVRAELTVEALGRDQVDQVRGVGSHGRTDAAVAVVEQPDDRICWQFLASCRGASEADARRGHGRQRVGGDPIEAQIPQFAADGFGWVRHPDGRTDRLTAPGARWSGISAAQGTWAVGRIGTGSGDEDTALVRWDLRTDVAAAVHPALVSTQDVNSLGTVLGDRTVAHGDRLVALGGAIPDVQDPFGWGIADDGLVVGSVNGSRLRPARWINC